MANEQKQMENVAEENFNVWEKTLHSGNPSLVAELYADSATFLPTVSPEFKKGPKEAEEYFEHFLQKFPSGVVVDREVQVLAPDTYLHSGLYNFELGPENDRKTVEARFSYVWKMIDGKWKIIHHHSSVRPQ